MTMSRSPKRPATSSRQQELRNTNAALAEQLAAVMKEHERDVAEANATIRELHSALSQTRCKLDVVEREQAARVHDVIKSLESLRSKLKHQEETKKAADARACQLAVLVQELQNQSIALQDTLRQREGQMLQIQRDSSEVSQQLASSQARVQTAESRIDELSEKVSGMTDDLSAAARSSEIMQTKLCDANDKLQSSAENASSQAEEIQTVKSKLIKVGGEAAHLKHLLTNEKERHEQTSQDLECSRAENKDLISQKAQLVATAASADEVQLKYESLQAEHSALETVLASRAHEVECLASENRHLASDWKLREDGLTGSHEIRIENLMNTLKEREQQNCDLHNQLHKSNVAIQSLKAEVTTTRQEAKDSTAEMQAVRAAHSKLSNQILDLEAAVDGRDQQIAALTRDNVTKSLQSEDELKRVQANCTELKQQIESLSSQLHEQRDSISERNASRDEMEKRHADQMSAMKASLTELGAKLVSSHSQHCEATARSEATVCSLNEKYGKATGDLAVLRSGIEAAALEQERAEGQMKRLQHELDCRTNDLQEAKLQLTKQTEESRLHQERVQQMEAQYTEQFKRQDRALKDIAAAMHQEEQAKVAAEKRLQTAKEQTISLEDEVRALTRKLEDSHGRCKEAEFDREEFQQKLKRMEALRQRDQAELRTLSRSKSTGRTYETWIQKSSKAMGAGLGDSPTYSAPGGLLRQKAENYHEYSPREEKLQLSSYHQRLAEIRSRGVSGTGVL